MDNQQDLPLPHRRTPEELAELAKTLTARKNRSPQSVKPGMTGGSGGIRKPEEHRNVVDGLYAIASAIDRLADAIKKSGN